LAEERRRGLTIEPGFAYLDVDGERWGFVDVPGHHRFVANMLTGAAGVDAALLVVAADDGVMPQTREHLAILQLLGIERLAVAVSKCDLVPEERLAEVMAELSEVLGAFPDAACIPVVAPTGVGLDALRTMLRELAGASRARANAEEAPLRFAVDRAFSVRGVGVVATGFVHSGRVAVGDMLELLPARRELRVRGLRAQDRDAEAGHAGERLALNLAGADLDAIGRGDWLVTPHAVPVASRIDARLECLPGVKLRSGTEVHVHHGTARTLGRLTVLDGPDSGPRVHLSLRTPVAALHGDRFVLRDAAAAHTLAGGSVLDHAPPVRGRARPERLAELDGLEAGDAPAMVRALQALHPLELDATRWATLFGLDAATLAGLLPDAIAEQAPGGRLLLRDAAAFGTLVDDLVAALERFHAGNPQLAGMGPDELRAVLRPKPSREVLQAALSRALETGRLERSASRYRAVGHRAALKGADAERWQQIRTHLAEPLVQPPVVHDLARTLDVAPADLEALLVRVHHTGEAVRVAANRFLLPDGVAALAHAAEACAAAAPDGLFAAREFKAVAGIGRNLAIDVLEYFDRSGLTRRRDDARMLVGSAEALFGPAPAGTSTADRADPNPERDEGDLRGR
ncbi:MAG: selenocysteine-specific translation elongation factor, partial [Pseudomonadales bacterium]|nr:selenocysteine-specific translation elongation factor [Pseudomonadales bacterium]